MSGLAARLLRIWPRHGIWGLDPLHTIGLASYFSRLARKGIWHGRIKREHMSNLFFFQAPNAKLWVARVRVGIIAEDLAGLPPLPQAVPQCMLSHPACMG
jgi:hypothetical protein